MKVSTASEFAPVLVASMILGLSGADAAQSARAQGASASVGAHRPLSTFHVYDLSSNGMGRKEGDRFISRAEALRDLEELSRQIEQNSAYMDSSTFDYRKAMAGIAAGLPAQVSVNGLSTQINRFIRLFGDDHAQVVDWSSRVAQGGAAFNIGKEGARYFLYTSAPGGFVDAQHPYVRSIDGVSIEEWMRVAGDLGQGPLSSTAARFSRAFQIFRYVDYMRSEMGLPTVGEPMTLEMVSLDGSKVSRIRAPLLAQTAPPSKPFSLPVGSRMLADNIGYLRIPAHTGELSERVIQDIPGLMSQFRDTDALIIDARQSGGGKRAVLNALFPYFMPADAAPYIFNVIKLRQSQVRPGQDPAELFDDSDKRFSYVGDPAVPNADMAAYRNFSADFIPTWVPPAGKFTDWYFMALKPGKDKPFYGKPVYMLVDWGVGSAGDIFASAFKSWPGVTLVGSPTMGRSGQGREYTLPNSKLEVNISTMASFQKTGERYDTVGVRPDIAIEPIASDWFGETDSVLARVQALAVKRQLLEGGRSE